MGHILYTIAAEAAIILHLQPQSHQAIKALKELIGLEEILKYLRKLIQMMKP